MSDPSPELQAFLSQIAARPEGGSLQLLVKNLNPKTERWLKLAAIPHSFDPKVFLAIDPGLGIKDAEALCDDLAELSVITIEMDGFAVDEASRSILFSDWLSDLAEDFISANRHLADYYSNLSRQAAESDDSTITWEVDRLRAKSIFHLFPVQREEALRQFEEYCRYQRHASHFDEIDDLIAIIKEYDVILEPRERVIIAYYEGKLAFDRGAFADARHHFHFVLDKDEGREEDQIKSLIRLGSIERLQQNTKLAIQHLMAAQSRLEPSDSGHQGALTRVALELGIIYRDSGDFKLANKAFADALRLAKVKNNEHMEAVILNARALLHTRADEDHAALEDYGNSLRILEKLKYLIGAAEVHNNLGSHYQKSRRFEDSERHFETCLKLSQRADQIWGQAAALNNLGKLYVAQMLQEGAKNLFEKAKELSLSTHNFLNAAVATRNLALAEIRWEQPVAAIAHLREAEQLAQKSARGTALLEQIQRDVALIENPKKAWPWVLTVIGLFILMMLTFAAIASF